MTERLIIFTRYPRPGKAKTRLIPALGAEAAAVLQRCMTEYMLQQVRSLRRSSRPAIEVEVWYVEEPDTSPDTRSLMQAWLGKWCYRPQSSGDLGDRMAAAFAAAFADGVERAVIIGTDCPQVDTQILTQAFDALESHDLVLGPAIDGGYYLIGLRRLIPALLHEIPWSTDRVLSETLIIAASLHTSIHLLAPLTDIDRPEDLSVWQAVWRSTFQSDSDSPQLSIIIPVLNEASQIATTLAAIGLAISGERSGERSGEITSEEATSGQTALGKTASGKIPIEIIAVDGGSDDQTCTIATALGAQVITAPRGRARQMNAGAAVATGDILLFLHADTQLPQNYAALIQQALSAPNVIAGAFQLQIAGDDPGLRWVEWGVKWRSRLWQLPYGDQAIFLKASTFQACGGFPDQTIMEDFVFVRQLRQQGRIAIVPAAVTTSGRRWQNLGVWRTTLINQMVIVGYFLGIDFDRLARWYRGK